MVLTEELRAKLARLDQGTVDVRSWLNHPGH